MKVYDIIIIGGGAAGMMAACAAKENNARVLLLEKNEKLGKKLYITGKGRCNVTNNSDANEFFGAIHKNGKFMYSSYKRFNSEDLMRYLEDCGLRLKIERGNRVFPASDKASDVIKALSSKLSNLGVDVSLRSNVTSIDRLNDSFHISTSICEYECMALIICTGGLSYPSTGCTGDGYRFAKDLGHTVTGLSPALTDITTHEQWPNMAAGLTLKNCCLKAVTGNKTLFCEQGELLITHSGISGPLGLSCSSMLSGEDLTNVTLVIDLKPALDTPTLDARLLRDFDKYSRKQLKNALNDLLPQSFISVFLELIAERGIDADTFLSNLTKDMRLTIAETLKHIQIHPKSLGGFDSAVITRGGISLKEIDPSSMGSKLCSGLYFAGEVLDLDALTGGYNLQIAFSTGHCAGLKSAEYILRTK